MQRLRYFTNELKVIQDLIYIYSNPLILILIFKVFKVSNNSSLIVYLFKLQTQRSSHNAFQNPFLLFSPKSRAFHTLKMFRLACSNFSIAFTLASSKAWNLRSFNTGNTNPQYPPPRWNHFHTDSSLQYQNTSKHSSKHTRSQRPSAASNRYSF